MFVHSPSVSVVSVSPSPRLLFPLLSSFFAPVSQVSVIRSPHPPFHVHHPITPQVDSYTFSRQTNSFSTFETTTPSGDKLRREVANGGAPVWSRNDRTVIHPGEIARLETLHQNALARQAMPLPLIPQQAVDRAINTINRTVNRAANIINGALQRIETMNPPQKIISAPFLRVTVF